MHPPPPTPPGLGGVRADKEEVVSDGSDLFHPCVREVHSYPQVSHYPLFDPPGLSSVSRPQSQRCTIDEIEHVPAVWPGRPGPDSELLFQEPVQSTPINLGDLPVFKQASPYAYFSPQCQGSGTERASESGLPSEGLGPIPVHTHGGKVPGRPHVGDPGGITPLGTASIGLPYTLLQLGTTTPFEGEQLQTMMATPILSPIVLTPGMVTGPTPIFGYESVPATVPDEPEARHPFDFADDSACSSPYFTSPFAPYPQTPSHVGAYANPSTRVFANEATNSVVPSDTRKNLILDRPVGAVFCDANGCKLIQQYLQEVPDAEKKLVDLFVQEFETPAKLEAILTHPSGNYCVQKVVELASEENRYHILCLIQGSLFSVCQNIHGTRSIQKLIEHMTSPAEKALIAAELGKEDRVLRLISDINGNHCVQRCIEHFTPGECVFIYDQIVANIVSVSTHQHGCCIAQRCLDACNLPQRQAFIVAIQKHALDLILDRYGNYVFQYALIKLKEGKCGRRYRPDHMIKTVLGKESQLITQKFASHVLEKCLEAGSQGMRRQIIDNIVGDPHFPNYATDRYGNYVIQRLFPYSTDAQKARISEQILSDTTAASSPFSRHVVQMCERFAGKLE
ncbi:putative Pumilio-family RNA-binding protein [Giardia muris]|uniref:Putative Pumilio-family RNA-binding protein n=1 Tax=Giardia muris TaxID=5742 RepID=A0A4Z1T6Q7_GIAMU|nr:putative Pumilio-family RNA-binding protein [Giardia muris]|eukprot:TNJ28817.1 putative Pumilio-family RNA-binding protein [Giardia muris]